MNIFRTKQDDMTVLSDIYHKEVLFFATAQNTLSFFCKPKTNRRKKLKNFFINDLSSHYESSSDKNT